MEIYKWVEKNIVDFISEIRDKKQIERMKTELEQEINAGLLTDIKYKKELDFINYRLEL